MKTYKKTAVSKLLDRFDNELKEILMNDLKAIKTIITKTNEHTTTWAYKQDSLTAA